MKKLKIGIGGLLMLSAMVISDRAEVFCVYALAAVLHELGHLAAAWAMGIGIDEVRLGFSGIRLVTDSRLTSYGKEILLAAAGPAINLISLGLCGAFFAQKEIALGEILAATDTFLETGEGDMLGALGFFALSSLMHAAVNLLPVSSFDGGRITSCLLARLFGVRVAERVVEITTLLSSVLLWTVALYLMLKVASGLGIFVFAACVFAICAERGGNDG